MRTEIYYVYKHKNCPPQCTKKDEFVYVNVQIIHGDVGAYFAPPPVRCGYTHEDLEFVRIVGEL